MSQGPSGTREAPSALSLLARPLVGAVLGDPVTPGPVLGGGLIVSWLLLTAVPVTLVWRR